MNRDTFVGMQYTIYFTEIGILIQTMHAVQQCNKSVMKFMNIHVLQKGRFIC